MSDYSIQDLCEQTSLPRRTIHFYVQQGLLPPPVGAGVAAHYTDIHLLCLQLIPLLRRKGLRLDDIRARLQGLDLSALRALYKQAYAPAPPALLPISQSFAHYALPAGMTLVVPATLTPTERKKLTEALKAITEIFGEHAEAL
jgi:DNA-binding transcriptional MerR regulator